MPQHTSFTIADRATTPVNHTFTPAGVTGGVTLNVEKGSNSLENKKITMSTREIRRPDGSKWKARGTVYVPVVQTQTLNGISVPVIARVGRVNIEVEVDSAATDQEKKDLLAYGYGLLGATHPFAMAVVGNEVHW